MIESGYARNDRATIRTTAAVTVVAIVVGMPSFLIAASGALLRVDFRFDEAGLGLAVSTFFGASACFSIVGGRWAERLGAGRTLALASASAGIVMLLIGALAQSYVQVVILLGLGGALNGLAQPAASLAIARGVSTHQGFVFGVKQSAVPLASLLAGASVPLVGIAFGWRIAFILGALLAALVAVLVLTNVASSPQRIPIGASRREGDARTAPLVTLSIAAGIGTAAALSLPSFLVESAVSRGIGLADAGWLLVAASMAGVVGRLSTGWLVDRGRGRALYVAAAMLVAGTVGYGMLAVGGPMVFAMGALAAYGLGWGWSGLLMYAIVRLNTNAPAAATGIVLTGAAGGAAIGPYLFGFVAARIAFDVAWALSGFASALAGGLLLVARSWLLRDRRRRSS